MGSNPSQKKLSVNLSWRARVLLLYLAALTFRLYICVARSFAAMAARRVVDHTVVGDWRLPDDEFLAKFKLPSPTEDRCTELQKANPLGPRENRIQFEEETHTYYIDGDTIAPRSVTGLVHMYESSEFRPHEVVMQMKRGKRWPDKRLEYLKDDCDESMSDDDICERWSKNGKAASARGTLLHFHAECLLNGVEVAEPHSPEFKQLHCLNGMLGELGYRPFRTEVCLFSVGLCVAGQADALYKHESTGHLCLLDWKRTKEIRIDNAWRSLREPLESLADCNGWLYALQLNTYAWILEHEYDSVVAKMYLGHVHPNLGRGRLLEVPKLQGHMQLLVEDQIQRGLAVSAASAGPNAPFVLPQQIEN